MTLSTSEIDRTPPFKNQSTALVAFGIGLILISMLAFVYCVLTAFSMVVISTINIPETAGVEPGMLLPGIVLYLLLGILFAILGGGSIFARRWARACILVLSWFWLICGLIGTFTISFLFNAIFSSSNLPPRTQYILLFIILLLISIFFIIIPLILVLFYRSPNVKATCEFRDPKVRWTDRYPLPVLALTGIMAFWAFGLLSLSCQNWVFPLFGTILSGYQGMLIVAPLIILAIIISLGIFRLHSWAWWAALILFLFWLISFSVTFSQNDFMSYYEAMNYSEEMLQSLRSKADALEPFFTILIPLYAIIPLGFLLFTRRFFYPKLPSDSCSSSSRCAPPGD